MDLCCRLCRPRGPTALWIGTMRSRARAHDGAEGLEMACLLAIPTCAASCVVRIEHYCSCHALSSSVGVCVREMKVTIRPHGRSGERIAAHSWVSTLVPKLAAVRSCKGGCPACGGRHLSEPPADSVFGSPRASQSVSKKVCAISVRLSTPYFRPSQRTATINVRLSLGFSRKAKAKSR